jgi:hypothetical protein
MADSNQNGRFPALLCLVFNIRERICYQDNVLLSTETSSFISALNHLFFLTGLSPHTFTDNAGDNLIKELNLIPDSHKQRNEFS